MKVIIYENRKGKESFPSLNDYIYKCRCSPIVGNNFKKKHQRFYGSFLPPCKTFKGAVRIKMIFYLNTRKKDPDNVAGFFTKVFLDAMVCQQVIHNDAYEDIKGISYEFEYDKKTPRIEVEIEEV